MSEHPIRLATRKAADEQLKDEFENYMKHATYEDKWFFVSALRLANSNDYCISAAVVGELTGELPKDAPDILRLVQLRDAVRKASKLMGSGGDANLSEIEALAN